MVTLVNVESISLKSETSYLDGFDVYFDGYNCWDYCGVHLTLEKSMRSIGCEVIIRF